MLIGSQVLLSTQLTKADNFFVKTNYIPSSFTLDKLERFMVSKNQMYNYIFIQRTKAKSIIGVGYNEIGKTIDGAMEIMKFLIENEIIVEIFESKEHSKDILRKLKEIKDTNKDKNISIENSRSEDKFMECFIEKWNERVNKNSSTEHIHTCSIPVSNIEKMLLFPEKYKFIYEPSPKMKYLTLKENEKLCFPHIDESFLDEITMHSSFLEN